MAAPLPDHFHEVFVALSRAPVGQFFSPTVVDTFLRALDDFATHGGIVPPAPDTGNRIYAVTNGANGVRVASGVESEADISGFRDGARKGFKDPGQARAYVAAYNYLRGLRTIPLKERELRDARDGFSSALSDLAVGKSIVKPRQSRPRDYTVKVTPIHHGLYVDTPQRLSAVVSDHLVEIDFTCHQPPTDPTAVFPERLDARGRDEPVAVDPRVPTSVYSSSGTIEVSAESANGAITRVIPHAVLKLDNGIRLDAFEPLAPIAPLPARDIEADVLYWVVLQGQQVGIFHATMEAVRPILPNDASSAKGFLTLEEASAFWHYELRRGWKLAEVREAAHVEDVALQTLEALQAEHPELAPLVASLRAR